MNNNSFIDKLTGFFILQWGWKRSMLAFVFGGFSAMSMPPVDMFWILFITLPVLVWLIDGTSGDPVHGLISRRVPSFITGWWFAFGYFLAGLWWIGAALLVEAETFALLVPIAVLGIPAFLALFWAIAITIAQMFWSDDWRRIVILALALGMAEYLRGTILTGFPWNLIGYAAMTTPVGMQSASVLGLYGITPLAIIVFASPAIFAPRTNAKPRRVRALLITSLILTISHVGFGHWRLQENPQNFVDGVKLRIVQPLILQEDKWEPENEARIFASYIDLSAADSDDITHYIWPESAFPFILTQRRDALAAIANLLPQDSYLITGAMRVEAPSLGKSEPRVFNSIYVINHKGEIAGAADKSHLVPFGEYLPFQKFADSLGLKQLAGREGGFTPALSRRILAAGNAGAFLPLICYEIIFPGQVLPQPAAAKTRTAAKMPNPDWIVNVTNDAWFGKTSGPYQHHRQSIIRGVEEGLPVVRAANSGVSSVSDAYGRIIAKLPLGERGTIDAALPSPAPTTFYRGYGNAGFMLIMFGLFVMLWKRTTH